MRAVGPLVVCQAGGRTLVGAAGVGDTKLSLLCVFVLGVPDIFLSAEFPPPALSGSKNQSAGVVFPRATVTLLGNPG
jgi:hypothetical protein